jgi:hypothetical protein
MANFFEKENIERFGYMDKITFEYELESDTFGSMVYPTINSLKADNICWKDCGIVKVRMTLEEVIEEGSGED